MKAIENKHLTLHSYFLPYGYEQKNYKQKTEAIAKIAQKARPFHSKNPQQLFATKRPSFLEQCLSNVVTFATRQMMNVEFLF